MQTIHRLDSTLYAKALRKEAELWDRILAVMSGEWERGWTLKWTLEPAISTDEVMQDLEFGRD
jgi:hypothetical protein